MEKDPINKPQAPLKNSNPTDDSISPYQLITTYQLAEKLGISRRNFYYRRKEIEQFISPVILGDRTTRYMLSDVHTFIKNGGLNARQR